MSDKEGNRSPGILTDRQRKFLTGEETYEGEHAKQQRYQRRKAIRKRVYNALLDFEILYEHLDDAEIEKLRRLDGIPVDDRVEGRESFYHGMGYALQFLYKIADISRDMHFDRQLERAVRMAELDIHDRPTNPTFYLNPQSTGLITGRAAEKIEARQYEALTVAEMDEFLRFYRESGEMDPSVPTDYVRWRYGTSQEPPKHDEMPFSEWREAREEDETDEE